MPDKEVFFIGEQPHDAKVSCGCLFAVLAKFRGKINLPDKIIVYVNALDTMAAGFIGSMDNDFLHKLPQKCRGQFSWLGVFLYDFQKTLDIDSLGLGGGYYALYDYSYAEIGRMCGCSKTAVYDSIEGVRKKFFKFYR